MGSIKKVFMEAVMIMLSLRGWEDFLNKLQEEDGIIVCIQDNVVCFSSTTKLAQLSGMSCETYLDVFSS